MRIADDDIGEDLESNIVKRCGLKDNTVLLDEDIIQNKIYNIRGIQVMLDRDLAELYGVETKHINQAVKNNPNKFPNDFMFALTKDEFENLRSNILTSSWGGQRYNPKAFTEQGVYMLATILKSRVATEATISIMRTFVKIKYFLHQNASLFDRFERIEQRLYVHDERINTIFKALEDKNRQVVQGIFYNGQIFDAYHFLSGLIKGAKSSIVLIDNYIDDSVLALLAKNPDIKITIYTGNLTKQLRLDINQYNAQYKNLEVKTNRDFHDRFLIIDSIEAYHIGASLKDAGKKIFGFNKFNIDLINEMLERLQ